MYDDEAILYEGGYEDLSPHSYIKYESSLHFTTSNKWAKSSLKDVWVLEHKKDSIYVG
jgi:hypothetical protein